MRPPLAVDLAEVRDFSHGSSDLRQQPQAVVAGLRVLGIDQDLLEEGVHRATQAREGLQGSGEVLGVGKAGDPGACLRDCGDKGDLFLGSALKRLGGA